ncbi:hypothetical protein CK203_073920 [Vitis vinifera]|uniref:Uncharacterized protein n=1 Tax=Vitis vinifera TaxID=29760 RepID=A0A438DQ13_VITVI|nr:hypothetical protein CK203_073920 [Vitis vinifera]
MACQHDDVVDGNQILHGFQVQPAGKPPLFPASRTCLVLCDKRSSWVCGVLAGYPDDSFSVSAVSACNRQDHVPRELRPG